VGAYHHHDCHKTTVEASLYNAGSEGGVLGVVSKYPANKKSYLHGYNRRPYVAEMKRQYYHRMKQDEEWCEKERERNRIRNQKRRLNDTNGK
jgi:hypothetical protein